MSKQTSLTVSCTRCGSRHKTTIYESVNVTLDPSLKSLVQSRAAVRFRCGSAGHEATLSFPFLYHDMDLRLAIWYVPDGVDDSLERAMDAFSRALGVTYRLRIVYEYNQLLETIDIFDAGMSDWFIQMLKWKATDENPRAARGTWYFHGFARQGQNSEAFTFISPELKESYTVRGIADSRSISKKFDGIEEELEWVHAKRNWSGCTLTKPISPKSSRHLGIAFLIQRYIRF